MRMEMHAARDNMNICRQTQARTTMMLSCVRMARFMLGPSATFPSGSTKTPWS